ncbi:hypothetical protein DFJ73DRAFT_966391 [Zopfochytrium polystomum]|nr:hypothetical protein DFJ73DRAFT_966391 [Zopfochytrium polystomum]
MQVVSLLVAILLGATSLAMAAPTPAVGADLQAAASPASNAHVAVAHMALTRRAPSATSHFHKKKKHKREKNRRRQVQWPGFSASGRFSWWKEHVQGQRNCYGRSFQPNVAFAVRAFDSTLRDLTLYSVAVSIANGNSPGRHLQKSSRSRSARHPQSSSTSGAVRRVGNHQANPDRIARSLFFDPPPPRPRPVSVQTSVQRRPVRLRVDTRAASSSIERQSPRGIVAS